MENFDIQGILDQTSIQKLKFAAQRGDPTAQCRLAVLLESEGDYSSAAHWYRFAAQQGNAQSQHNLGCLLLEGRGVDQDFSEAKQWFSDAARQGYLNSVYNLAFVLERGLGCKTDKVRAYELYKEAADRGDTDSQCKVAMILLEKTDQDKAKIKHHGTGWPVSSNSAEARKLLKLASANGHKLSTDILTTLGWNS